MRGKRAKSIRKYVRDTFPFLPDETLYKQGPDGVITLAIQCKRAVARRVKDNYKRVKRGLEAR